MNKIKFSAVFAFEGITHLVKPLGKITLLIIMLFMVTLNSCALDNISSPRSRKIPVIFDTDICDDIDDTWALAMLLQSDEFDVKLITTAVGNTSSKAKTVAKFLQAAGRTDIPIGIGVQQHNRSHRQDAWAKNFDLSSYSGKIYKDGIQALIDTIMKSPKPVKVVAVGPLPKIAAALERETKIADKAEFIGMHGSIYLGYGGSSQPSPEYNVRAYVEEAQKVFTAGWDMTITPLDTCGLVQLKGQKYQKVLNRKSPVTMALIQNYHAWYKQGLLSSEKDISADELTKKVNQKLNSSSSTLFDTVAIYLAMSNTDLVKMKKLPIKVTDDGYTKVDKDGKLINCAVEWKDLGAFEDFLVDRLIK
jgi:inosine-uridine nucleoside N-ribohydrolase